MEAGGLGYAYVGLDGLQDTYGTEDRLIDALLYSIPDGLKPRLGVSDGKFPAYVAAMKAPAGRAYKPPASPRAFVAPLPVDVLPVPWAISSRLHSSGLHTIGDIASLPLGPVQAQFGSEGTRLWRLAQGMDDSPLLPMRPEEEVTESLTFLLCLQPPLGPC